VAAIRDQRPYNVAYYSQHREQEISRVTRRQRATLEFLRELRRRPCADCGGVFSPWVMDFDHRDPAKKAFNVMSGRAMLRSRSRLMAEIDKCDIVCANCHAARTYKWLITREKGREGTSRRLEEKRLYWRAHAKLLEQLRDVACVDCGLRFPSYVMQFDHRDSSEKKYTVTRMIGRAGRAKILEEAAKCDIVCANCHRERTFRRRTGSAGVA
jgi:formate-dependent nitrite reductase cytochrome c552 subunit